MNEFSGEIIPPNNQEIQRENAPKTSEVLEKLKPRKIIDAEGNSRDVYSFTTKRGNNIQAVFYSPEELPFSNDLLSGNPGYILGQKPRWRTDVEWSGFVSQVATSSERRTQPLSASVQYPAEAIQSNRAVYFVESNPTSLLDFAFTLGVEDSELRTARLETSHNKMTSTAQAIVDDAIAAKVVADEGKIKSEKDYEGEALLVLSLLGDEDAKEIMNRKKAQFDQINNAARAKELQAFHEQVQEYNYEALQLKDLAAVHTTRYIPQRNGDHWEMQTTFDATGGKAVRQSIHFSLNHAVEGHMYGSWEAAPIVIISPLDKMIDQNGNPALLNTVDTFFEVSPGTTLKLPEGTSLVKPGQIKGKELFEETSSGEVNYKARDYTPEDVHAIGKFLTEHGVYYTNEHIKSLITEKMRWDKDYMKEDGSSIFTEEEQHNLFDILGGLQARDLLSELGEHISNEVLQQVFTEAGIYERIHTSTITTLQREIETKFADIVKKRAVNEELEKMGYVVHSGGMWAWGDSFEVTHKTAKLGDELGVLVGPHTGHISHRIQEGFMGGWGGEGLLALLLNGDITPKEYRERAYKFANEHITEVSQPARRMLYAMGAI